MRLGHTFESLMRRIQVCEHGMQCGKCCWPWLGGLDRHGYGQVKYLSGNTGSHRAVYQAYKHLDLPRQRYVLHTCQLRTCCNHHHLYEGSQRRNVQDAIEYGSIVAKLNDAKVLQMRRSYWSGGWSVRDLADVFHIRSSWVHTILLRKAWSHVQGEVIR